MNRIALATVVAVLGLPASAVAARSSGVVLSLSSAQRMIQVIAKTHSVGAFHYRGNIPALRRGSRISFARFGQRIANVTTHGRRSTRLTFSGTVVGTGAAQAVVRLADGETVRLHPIRVHGLGGGPLTDGSDVLVTERLGRDPRTTVTVTRLGTGSTASKPGGGGPALPGQVQAVGTVVEIDSTSFVLQTAGGDMRFDIAPSQLWDLQLVLCNVASVLYTPGDATVTFDDVTFANNDSTSGQCADPGPPSGKSTTDAIGPITQLTLSSVTVSTENGPMRFAATIDLTNNFLVGDTVDVSYAQGSGRAPIATDIEYDDYDAIGTVTAVSAGSVTIADSSTGQSRTFTDDPSNGTFEGISVGDDIDVSYYYSSGHIVVDYVTDLS